MNDRKRAVPFMAACAIMAIIYVITQSLAPVPAIGVMPKSAAAESAQKAETIALQKPDEPKLTAKSAIVIDADSMEVLYEKNASERRAPASVTKLMTLLLAVEMGDMDETVTVPQSAGTVPADSSRVPVYPGEKMPFRDLVYSLMIKSGNDAANAIGTLVSGSVDSFVKKMNARASEMGLKDTAFKNTHGYPTSGHYSTASDIAKLMTRVINNASARKVLKCRSYTMSGGRKIANSYAILNPDSDYYYRYAIGGKTGYSQSSGQCFACFAEKDGRTLVSVVLSSGLGKPEKWKDTKALFEYGFSV